MTMPRKRAAMLLTTTTLAMGAGAGAGGTWLAARAEAQTAAPVTPKTQTPSEARALSRAFANVSRALAPSVVRIDVEGERPQVARNDRRNIPPDLERFFERFLGEDFEIPNPGPGKGTGSGVVMDAAGHIITNSHVVEKAAKVTVSFSDGREFSAKVVGRDPRTDLAVVKLDKAPAGLVAARIGDSGKLEVGEWVLAIGSPLGLDQSVTAGIISSKGKVGRNVHMSQRVREYIQTDAKINPGNSGGPLVNLDGEVIGINTLINMGPGGAYGFAIPVNLASRVAKTIITDGRVRHAYLGITLGDVKDGVKMNRNGEPDKSQGGSGLPPRAAWVREVNPDTPAQRAGLHVGDVITQIDKQKIESSDDVVDYVSSRAVGNRVAVSYVRDGRNGSLQITLGEMPDEVARAGNPQIQTSEGVGLSMQTLTPDMARALNMAGAKGAVVTEVEPGSRAARAGLRDEDVIVEINRKAVTSAAEASAALRDNPKGGHLLRIRRGGSAQFVTIPAQ
jgi:serine protease Do